MLPINKNTTDPLSEHRKQFNAEYGNIPKDDREALKNSLLSEQKTLCCYCMRKIELDSLEVEHWKDQSTHKHLALDYKNILASCKGNRGLPYKHATCNNRKKDKEIRYNPAIFEHHNMLCIIYEDSGKIMSVDEAFNNDINTILNLNYAALVNDRKRVVDEVMAFCQSASKEEAAQKLSDWKTGDGKSRLNEYAGVAIYFLEQFLPHAQ